MLSKRATSLILLCGWLLGALLACGGSQPQVDSTTTPSTPVVPKARLVSVSGQNQSADPGMVLAAPVRIRLLDPGQRPMVGESVRFQVVSGGGSVDAGVGITDAAGEASVRWWVGPGPEQVLKASRDEAVAAYVFANSRLSSEYTWTRDMEIHPPNQSVTHDNRILETPHFLVFSDASSDDTKVIYAKMAEESFQELMDAFQVGSPGALGIDTSRPDTKIRIYSIKNARYDQAAFRHGFILYGLDAPSYQTWGWDDFRYRREVKHETVHVLSFKFGMDGRYPGGASDTWFVEGIAEALSGGAFPAITTVHQWNQWQGVVDHRNPISIHRWSDMPVPYGRTGEYYPAFGLAVRYLMDVLGKRAPEFKVLFGEILQGSSFARAFEKMCGMSLETFERDFPRLVADFLQPTQERMHPPSSKVYTCPGAVERTGTGGI